MRERAKERERERERGDIPRANLEGFVSIAMMREAFARAAP